MIYTEVTDIQPYMTKCYETEVHLYPDFGYGEVQDPAHMAKLEAQAMNVPTAKHYIVTKDDNFVGYFCTYDIYQWNALGSFFIVPEFRSLKLEFFNLISGLLDNKYIMAIKKNNVRALKFIEKLGAKKYYTFEDDDYFKVGEF